MYRRYLDTGVNLSFQSTLHLPGMGESESKLGLESRFSNDSNSTWTRQFVDIDSTWTRQFVDIDSTWTRQFVDIDSTWTRQFVDIDSTWTRQFVDIDSTVRHASFSQKVFPAVTKNDHF